MALAASAAGIALKFSLHHGAPRLVALAVIAVYSAVYLGLARLTGETELQRLIAYASRRLRARG
jgi:NADH:ubiquinone oxidoreductase subunit 4 (subunit M)